jgi:molybdopterin-guanine dinucleotide biosynthesis protein A
MVKIEAIVLAGNSQGRDSKKERQKKTLWKFRGHYLAEYPIHALRSANSIGKITVVGHPELAEAIQCPVVEPGEKFIGSVRNGLESAQPSGRVLWVFGDAVMVSAEAIDDFVQRADTDADLTIPLIRKEYLVDFHTLSKHYFGLKVNYHFVECRQGSMGITSPALLQNPGLSDIERAIQKSYEVRMLKYVWPIPKMAWHFGRKLGWHRSAKLLLNLKRKRLDLETAREAVSDFLGLRLGVTDSHYPHLWVDIDYKSDLRRLEVILHRNHQYTLSLPEK